MQCMHTSHMIYYDKEILFPSQAKTQLASQFAQTRPEALSIQNAQFEKALEPQEFKATGILGRFLLLCSHLEKDKLSLAVQVFTPRFWPLIKRSITSKRKRERSEGNVKTEEGKRGTNTQKKKV